MTHLFKNRSDAALQLAAKLRDYKNTESVILAIPRGGVAMGAMIAKELNLPLDIALTKKIGHPLYTEYAIGAVTMDDSIIDQSMGVSQAFLNAEIERLQQLLKDRYIKFRGDAKPLGLKNKTVILVDDGIATGYTMAATLKMIKKEQVRETVVVAPVISPQALTFLAKECDRILTIKVPDDFRSVGQYYTHFEQVTEKEVSELLKKS